MKGFIKELKELQQAGKKLADERKAKKRAEYDKDWERRQKAARKSLKERERKEEEELERKIAYVRTFSSSNVEIRQNYGMVFCSTFIRSSDYYDSIEILEKEVLTELKRQTLKRRGDAIINLRFEFTRMKTQYDGKEMLLTGYGDAVTLPEPH